jgi:hypothetical protein
LPRPIHDRRPRGRAEGIGGEAEVTQGTQLEGEAQLIVGTALLAHFQLIRLGSQNKDPEVVIRNGLGKPIEPFALGRREKVNGHDSPLSPNAPFLRHPYGVCL